MSDHPKAVPFKERTICLDKPVIETFDDIEKLPEVLSSFAEDIVSKLNHCGIAYARDVESKAIADFKELHPELERPCEGLSPSSDESEGSPALSGANRPGGARVPKGKFPTARIREGAGLATPLPSVPKGIDPAVVDELNDEIGKLKSQLKSSNERVRNLDATIVKFRDLVDRLNERCLDVENNFEETLGELNGMKNTLRSSTMPVVEEVIEHHCTPFRRYNRPTVSICGILAVTNYVEIYTQTALSGPALADLLSGGRRVTVPTILPNGEELYPTHDDGLGLPENKGFGRADAWTHMDFEELEEEEDEEVHKPASVPVIEIKQEDHVEKPVESAPKVNVVEEPVSLCSSAATSPQKATSSSPPVSSAKLNNLQRKLDGERVAVRKLTKECEELTKENKKLYLDRVEILEWQEREVQSLKQQLVHEKTLVTTLNSRVKNSVLASRRLRDEYDHLEDKYLEAMKFMKVLLGKVDDLEGEDRNRMKLALERDELKSRIAALEQQRLCGLGWQDFGVGKQRENEEMRSALRDIITMPLSLTPQQQQVVERISGGVQVEDLSAPLLSRESYVLPPLKVIRIKTPSTVNTFELTTKPTTTPGGMFKGRLLSPAFWRRWP